VATYTVFTYCCPRCKADLGRRFGLITTPSVVCPGCGANVRIDRNVIAQNWGYNFAWVGGLLAWAALAAAVLLDPAFAATLGNKTLPAGTFEQRLVIAGFCAIPALFAGLLLGGVGMLLGTIVSVQPSRSAAPPEGQPAGPPRGAPGFAPAGAPAVSPPRPQDRGFLVRAFFVLLWPVVVFFGAASVIGLVLRAGVEKEPPAEVVGAGTVGLLATPAGQGPLLAASSLLPRHAREEQRIQQAVAKRSEKTAPWLLLGTLAVFILGCLGLMPSTGRKRQGLEGKPGSPAPALQPRGYLVRGVFVLFWPIAFFLVAAVVMSMSAGGLSAQTDGARQQLNQQSAQAHAGWISLVSLLLFVLGCLGFLPWTGRMKRS
jgi:hypothetical protein